MDKKKPPLNLNLMRAVLKPMFEHKLRLKRASSVSFKAYKLKDELYMEGFGMLKNSVIFSEAKCDVLKISENEKYESMLIRNLNKHCQGWKQWDVCYATIDYETNTMKTEVWYVSKDGGKKHQIFENNF